MRLLSLISIILPAILVSSCKDKVEVVQIKANSPIITNLDNAFAIVNQAFSTQLKYNVIDCPPGWEGSQSKNIRQRCFTVDREPEELLSEITNELKQYGKAGIQWRMDVGTWLSTYQFDGEKFSAWVSLIAPGNSEALRDDPAYKNIKTFGRFFVSDERNRQP